MKKIGGVFPALFTPFSDNGIKTDQIKALIDMNIQKGVSGFYVNGSSGEAFLMTDEERRLVYKTAREAIGDRAAAIAHVGCISTAQTVSFGKYAASLKYDAISAVTPFYYKFSTREIKKYYRDVQEQTGMPLMIYNIPALSGVELSYDDLAELLSSDGIIGVKHTSSDFFKMQRLKSAFPEKTILNGYDEMFLSGLIAGADGGIGSTYNFMAEKFIAIEKLFRTGDIAGAQKIQDAANKIIAALLGYGVMPGCKAILDSMGFSMGDSRPPFSALTDKEKSDLISTVSQYM